MKNKRLWLTGILVAAAGALVTLQTVSAPVSDSTPAPAAITDTVAGETPAGDTSAPSGDCGYMWATHDNPELSTAFEQQVKAIDANASAHVSGYGEDCIYADGRSTFLVMQTDFYVRRPVTDLANEAELGNFAARVMESVLQIPRDEIPGPNDGFVEFRFEQSAAGQNILRIPIQQYITEAQGMTGAELIQKFSSQP